MEFDGPSDTTDVIDDGASVGVASTFALFLDFDGTLVDLTEAPRDVRVPPALLSDLVSLRGRLGGALALVSSRTISDIDRLLNRDDFDVAGVYGAELRIGKRLARMSPDAPEILRRVKARIRVLTRIDNRCIVEDKGVGFAVHWPKAPHLETVILDHVQEAVAALGSSYRLLRGKSVVEVMPMGALKSGAIARYLCLAPYAGRIPIFIGDDITDEAGFDLVNLAGGITVRVGDHRTSATHRLSCPKSVRNLVARWAAGAPFGLL